MAPTPMTQPKSLFSLLGDEHRLDPGRVRMGELLGEGFFSRVYKGQLEINGVWEDVAIKALNGASEPQMVEREINVSNIQSDYITRVFGWFQESQQTSEEPRTPTQNSSSIKIVLEFCGGGDVASLIQKYPNLSQDVRIRILHHAALGLQHLHGCGIMHRDLKAENVILKAKITDRSLRRDVRAKLTDFGLSRPVQKSIRSRYTATVGTPLLIAPECFTGGDYDEKSDVFMFGLLILQVFQQTTDPDEVRNADFSFNSECVEKMNLSTQLKILIKKCCAQKQSRIDVDDLVASFAALDRPDGQQQKGCACVQ